MRAELSRIILFVDDIEAMARFYGETLGLAAVADGSEADFRIFRAGGADVCLHAIPAAFRSSAPYAPREDTYVKFCFRAADVEAGRAELVAKGVVMKEVVRYGELTFCDGADPEGNIFQLSNR